MKNRIVLLLLLGSTVLPARNLTLDRCLQETLSRYPLAKQSGLLDQTEDLQLSDIGKSLLPQVSLSARASLQSDVTAIPSSLETLLSQLTGQPVHFESLGRDQYQAMADIQQTLWDGGVARARRAAVQSSTEASRRQLAADLYTLREKVLRLYFGILLIREQQEQVQLLRRELETNLDRVNAGMRNGVAQQSDADAIRVEVVKARQQQTDLAASDRSMRQQLAAFSGLAVPDSCVLEKPSIPGIAADAEIRRPELALFDARIRVLDAGKMALQAANRPKVSAFLQAGYANPALNMFESGFKPLYIGGVQLVWRLSERYTRSNQLQSIELGRRSLELQKEAFLFNTNLESIARRNEISKLEETLRNDEEIISLRGDIKKAAQARYANGTITVNDLLTDITAENMAAQTRLLHEIQLYLAYYELSYNLNQ